MVSYSLLSLKIKINVTISIMAALFCWGQLVTDNGKMTNVPMDRIYFGLTL